VIKHWRKAVVIVVAVIANLVVPSLPQLQHHMDYWFAALAMEAGLIAGLWRLSVAIS
jgi:hypothetical protein